VRVLTQESDDAIPVPLFPETRVTAQRPFREWQAYRWLRNRVRKDPTNRRVTICGLWYPEGLLAYLAGVRPLVILAHGAELLPTVSRWRRRVWISLQRRVLESADLVIANSDYTGRLATAVAAGARVEAIPLGVNANRFVPGDRAAARAKFNLGGKRVLCTVARIEPYKAHDLVLRAIADLDPAERKQVVYLVVGRGSNERELRRQAVQLGIESQVRWLGFVSEKELPQVYWASDLFVLCTRESPEDRSVEGFGLVFLEAQSCGTPVVGTRTGGIPAAVQEGHGGWLIDQDDSGRLTGIIRQLVESPETFREAGIRARQRILQDGTWERYGRRFSAALQKAGLDV
jgi:phosphatidylinositol alpha-1,6-mannosyltransferase